MDCIEYNRARAKAMYTFRNGCKNSWNSFINSININTPMSKIWSRIAKMSGKYRQHAQPYLEV